MSSIKENIYANNILNDCMCLYMQMLFWLVRHLEIHKPDELKLNSLTQLAHNIHNVRIKKIFGKCAALVIKKKRRGSSSQ